MKYTELVEMYREDAKIDGQKLDHEALRIPTIQGKYFNLYCQMNGQLSGLQKELKVLKQWKRDYFLGEIPQEQLIAKGIPVFPRRIVKTEVDLFIDTDPEILALLEKITVIQIKVDFLRLCLDELKYRGQTIKSAIEFLKYKHGVI